MSYRYGYNYAVRPNRRAVALPSATYVWLGATLAAAPALGGVPAGSTFINTSDTAYVTRNGVKMLSVSGGTASSNNAGFASVPWWQQSSAFGAVQFELPAGTAQIGFIMSGAGAGNNMLMVDDPLGAAMVRQSIALAGAANSLSNTSGTTYPTAGTAIANAVAGMTFVPVQVTNLGGGVGVVRVYANGAGALISAIALRAP